jgi:hypothetical protein
MFIGVSVGLKARLLVRALPGVAAAEYRNPPLGLTLILAFAPAASDGARPHDSPIRRFNNILNAELRTIFARFFIPDVPD